MMNNEPMPERVDLTITVNGRRYRRQVEPRLHLADFLRQELGLTGTHIGCEQGVCGNCTVLVDGEAVKSCLMFAAQVDGQRVTTVESLAGEEELHPLQRVFKEEHALQCGYCTPGFLMLAAAIAAEGRSPSREELREELSGVICRCTGYENVLTAVQRYLGDPEEVEALDG
jgi:aerobic-type carbon monoxide dehydrogenase small subunit (CoxS/CutS family)